MTSFKRSFKTFVVQELGEFPHFMVWAVLEWILIVSLYVDGFVAFLSNTFAKIFDLEPPCVLCTRVDHALVGKDPNSYYNESICECHKKDISSLAYCHVHRKLSDIQNMCEGCLLAFPTDKESDTYTNKCLQKNNDVVTEDDPKPGNMVKDYVDYNDDVNKCSCCGEPLKMKPSSKGYARSFSNLRASAFTALHYTRPPITPNAWKTEDSRYTELKFISDNEPDMPEDDFGFNTDTKQVREEMKSGTMSLLPDSEDMNEESCKTPNFAKGNKFFGIPLTDSTSVSPRWANKITKKVGLEKPEIISEFNDDALVDGESSLQYLKKQVRMDRKSLIALSMELDEERSAAAIAANNAMAMITRLQTEKAAVQMEALQYQRMMEEQAEYDQEAIQILKDMLSKSDEHVKVMELELESYRENYGEIRKVGSYECEADGDEYYQEWRSQSLSSFGERSECWSIGEKDHDEVGESFLGKFVENEKDNTHEESEPELEPFGISTINEKDNTYGESELELEPFGRSTKNEKENIYEESEPKLEPLGISAENKKDNTYEESKPDLEPSGIFVENEKENTYEESELELERSGRSIETEKANTHEESEPELERLGRSVETEKDNAYEESEPEPEPKLEPLEKSTKNEKDNTYEESKSELEPELEPEPEPLFDFENEKHQLYGMLKNLENHIHSASNEDEWDDKDKDIVQENRASLKREVSLIRERLRALEADSGFLKHTALTLQKGDEGTKLLTEIAQHLRKLCNSDSFNNQNTTDT